MERDRQSTKNSRKKLHKSIIINEVACHCVKYVIPYNTAIILSPAVWEWVHVAHLLQLIYYRYSHSPIIMCVKHTCPQTLFLPFQPVLQDGQDQRAVKGREGQDCRSAQGWNGLQEHQQEG